MIIVVQIDDSSLLISVSNVYSKLGGRGSIINTAWLT